MTMKVPLVDLKAQYQRLKPEIDAAVGRVLASGQFILGPEVKALEQELAAYCGTTEAVSVASGTDALELSLRACGIGPGDEVITTASSFFATAEAILAVGARPVFVDIEPLTYTIDVAQIVPAVSPRTKAILPVHLYGHPCDMDALMRIAQRYKLLVIEDGAQAIGARDREQRVGSFGIAGCFSFFPSKNLGAYGDGGAVVTNDGKVAEHLRLLRVHGSSQKYVHTISGRNSRLDELQAAILRAKLPYLEAWHQARRQHAQTYR
ncbi:MAG: DegT/DnrJ/EryC1/StrS family aminotransferase, partial [Chloroflexota bacterium]